MPRVCWFSFVALILASGSIPAHAQCVPTPAKWSASASLPKELMGSSVALDGNTAVIGRPASVLSTFPTPGYADVYIRNTATGTWSLQATLTASDAQLYSRFGSSVAIDGETIVVGSSHHDTTGPLFVDCGAAYVFVRDPITRQWSQQAKLLSPVLSSYVRLGTSVAIQGDIVVVGAPGEDTVGLVDSGAVYVFVRNSGSGSWSPAPTLQASDPGTSDWFGYEVAIDADDILIGSPFDDEGLVFDRGSAYVFHRTGIGYFWVQSAKLSSPEAATFDRMGTSVAIEQGVALVGSPGNNFTPLLPDSGAVYHYGLDAGSGLWSLKAKFAPPSVASADAFGTSVRLSNQKALIGSPAANNPYAVDGGLAYLFSLDPASSTWSQLQPLSPNHGASGDLFGIAVALDGPHAAIGASQSDATGVADSGAAFVFDNILDLDGDQLVSNCDNCPLTFNPDQADTDGDGIGNACQIDLLGPIPGVAGVVNTFTLDDASPNTPVALVFGSIPISLPIVLPGCLTAITLRIQNYYILGFPVTDGTGMAMFNIFVPPTAAGLSGALFQALDISGCGLGSDLLTWNFP